MLDDVATHPHTKILRALRRAVLVALGQGADLSGEAIILAEPYRTILAALPPLEEVEPRVQRLTAVLPPIAAMANAMRNKDRALFDELAGLIGDLGYGDLISKYLEPLLAAAGDATDPAAMAQATDPAAMAQALRTLGLELRQINTDGLDKIDGLAERFDDVAMADDTISDEGNLIDDHGLTPDDRRRWSQALRELAVRQGFKLEDAEVAPALDFLMGRMNELEEDDEVEDEDWPTAEHVPGADRVQLTIPVDVLGAMVMHATHVGLLSLPTTPEGVAAGSDEHAIAIARSVTHHVERSLMDGRRKLQPVGERFANEARELLPGRLWARFALTGALEVSLDGQQGIGLEPAEQRALLAFALEQRPDLAAAVAATAERRPASDQHVD